MGWIDCIKYIDLNYKLCSATVLAHRKFVFAYNSERIHYEDWHHWLRYDRLAQDYEVVITARSFDRAK